ncbi:hypothetical protein MXB_3025, partial [Myxobolus squamalis]
MNAREACENAIYIDSGNFFDTNVVFSIKLYQAYHEKNYVKFFKYLHRSNILTSSALFPIIMKFRALILRLIVDMITVKWITPLSSIVSNQFEAIFFKKSQIHYQPIASDSPINEISTDSPKNISTSSHNLFFPLPVITTSNVNNNTLVLLNTPEVINKFTFPPPRILSKSVLSPVLFPSSTP